MTIEALESLKDSETSQIKRQVEELQEKLESARAKERANVLLAVRGLVKDFDLRHEDIFGCGRTPPKYADPATGKTWAGRGIAPAWIKGKNYDDFLIRKPEEKAAA